MLLTAGRALLNKHRAIIQQQAHGFPLARSGKRFRCQSPAWDEVMNTATPVSVVLVVEDELMLRMRAVDIVEDAGFVPIEAVNADQAIQILESRNDIAVLFTDIQMPGSMDGLRLAHHVHSRWPHIKIILVS
ncbi:response regulator, partial [Phenylobacterium sp.]|uniref:response regulator n=1 Tax=Phenylobacterium sp. TaxID=1871053 RepID=UPI00286E5FD6